LLDGNGRVVGATKTRDRMGLAGIGWDPVPGLSIWHFWIPCPGFWCYRDHWSNLGATKTRDRMGLAGIGWDPVPGFSIWHFCIPGPGFWCYRDHWSNLFLASGYKRQRKDVYCFSWSYRLDTQYKIYKNCIILRCNVIFH